MKSTILSLVVLCVTSGPASAGEIRGVVRLRPGTNGSISPAVVYVAAKPATPEQTPAAAHVDQLDLRFVPRVQAVVVGTPIIFQNSDREAHNVSSQSGCCSFNFMVAPRGEQGPGRSEPVETTRPGLIRLLCNIHQQMRGYVVVCPTPAFAVADSSGHFRIENVPDGLQRIHVWQEYSKPLNQEVEVAGIVELELELEAVDSVVRAGASEAAETRVAAVPWTEVVRRIRTTLEQAIAAAQRPGGGAEAERLALDAYFEHFEASELEAAVRLFHGEQRVFDVERAFMRIRKPLLVELAAGTTDRAAVQRELDELIRGLNADLHTLHAKGVRDRSTLYGQARSSGRSTVRVAKSDVEWALAELRGALDRVHQAMSAGDGGSAASRLADAYFQIFHRIEPALAARDFVRTRAIERRFLELRGHLQDGLSGDDARVELDALFTEIDASVQSLDGLRGTRAEAINGFWNALIMITREGTEALLIITALLMYLNRMGRIQEKRIIYWGLAFAGIATVATWVALQWLIAQAGMAQELIEGIASLAAAGLLFYVSYWLVSKSEAKRWQSFLTRQVDQSLSLGSRWSIGLAAFLAVYREGAETIFMFQPMLIDPSPHQLTGVTAGVATAGLILGLVCWGLRFATVRMAIRPFFRVTGALLFALAVVFAGKAVIELQEANVLTVSPLPAVLRDVVLSVPAALRDALGLAPTVQSIAVQSTLLLGACVSFLALWLTSFTSAAAAREPGVVHLS